MERRREHFEKKAGVHENKKYEVRGVVRTPESRNAKLLADSAQSIGWLDRTVIKRASLPLIPRPRWKGLGDNLGAIVTLCKHEDGRPVAMASYRGETARRPPP
jgi:hypothetical protein